MLNPYSWHKAAFLGVLSAKNAIGLRNQNSEELRSHHVRPHRPTIYFPRVRRLFHNVWSLSTKLTVKKVRWKVQSLGVRPYGLTLENLKNSVIYPDLKEMQVRQPQDENSFLWSTH